MDQKGQILANFKYYPSPSTGLYLTCAKIDWNPVSGTGTVEYRFRYDDDSDLGSSPIYTSGWMTATEYTFPTPLAEDTYYWQVQARDDNGEGPWASYWTFTIGPPPSLTIDSASVDGYISVTCPQ